MPWTDDQALLLRECGVSWVPRVRTAATGSPSADRVPARGAGGDSGAGGSSSDSSSAPGQHAVAPASATPAAARVAGVPAPAPPVTVATRPEVVLPATMSGLDWDALARAVQACQACSLCQTRRQTVFGVGSHSARWLVVGEAPGEQEDLKGEPFVGAAGRLLDQMLLALDLTRSADAPAAADGTPSAEPVYIANTLKCRPPGNRNPSPEELSLCEPFLVRQIELLQPRIILAMGRFAVQMLLRTSDPIGRLRGRVHRYRGVPLVVTYHPAYLLRNPADKARAWEDLCLAAASAG